MTTRRAFVAGALAVLSAPLAAQEKPPARIYRVGMLDIVSAPANAANLNELRKGLRELGYVEGKNLLIEHRSAAAVDRRLGREFMHVGAREDSPRALEAAPAHNAAGFLVRAGGLGPADRKTVVELAAQHKLPAMYVSRQFVDLGGLVSYGVN